MTRKYRIESIDLLRGVVMVIMALDHCRAFFNYGFLYADPTDLATTTPLLFFTRWITHFCAPVFVFLAGTSAFLYGTRQQSTSVVSRFLFTRGLWLIVLELTVVNLAWTFDVQLGLHIFQVIWAIGVSMVVLALLVFLPRGFLMLIGIILVAGHNLLDPIVAEGQGALAIAWYVLHQDQFLVLSPDSAIFFHYPVIPWIGTMVLGYLFGNLYRKGIDSRRRRQWLRWMGIGAITLFLALRFSNFYGDLNPWSPQDTLSISILSFLNTTKYPPSLLFLLMTLGPAMVFLSLTEQVKNRFSDMLVVIGRVPLFFYVLHLYFIHVLAIIAIGYAGISWTEMIMTVPSFLSGTLTEYGYNLGVVYAVWGFVIVALYPFCRWYNAYKSSHRDLWWMSYL